MKTKISLLGIMLLIVTLSCNYDNDDNQNTNPETENTYSLTQVQGGFAGIDDSFPMGLITWTFDDIANTITIDNNNTNDELTDIFESGTYDYSIVDQGGVDQIIIDGFNLGVIIYAQNEITIDQQAADGYFITLSQ